MEFLVFDKKKMKWNYLKTVRKSNTTNVTRGHHVTLHNLLWFLLWSLPQKRYIYDDTSFFIITTTTKIITNYVTWRPLVTLGVLDFRTTNCAYPLLSLVLESQILSNSILSHWIIYLYCLCPFTDLVFLSSYNRHWIFFLFQTLKNTIMKNTPKKWVKLLTYYVCVCLCVWVF